MPTLRAVRRGLTPTKSRSNSNVSGSSSNDNNDGRGRRRRVGVFQRNDSASSIDSNDNSASESSSSQNHNYMFLPGHKRRDSVVLSRANSFNELEEISMTANVVATNTAAEVPITTTSNQLSSLESPVIVYHKSAHEIVFRDQIRRASVVAAAADADAQQSSSNSVKADIEAAMAQLDPTADLHHHHHHGKPTTEKQQQQQQMMMMGHTVTVPRISPLPALELTPNEEFEPLRNASCDDDDDDNDNDSSTSKLNTAEQDVIKRLKNQTAVVKTIANEEWTVFLQRFLQPEEPSPGKGIHHQDTMQTTTNNNDGEGEQQQCFNSFCTSTTILPPMGLKVKCYGSTTKYSVGVVFPLPTHYTSVEEEDEDFAKTETWAWPCGYAAKTEFNVDGRGHLINGRKDALAPVSVMRQYNNDYVNKTEYMVGLKKVSGMSLIPYNEVYIRVGGKGRIVDGVEVGTVGKNNNHKCQPSYETGLGLPIALFVRSATYGNLISLMRVRARLIHMLGESHFKDIPLVMITPTNGVRVFTQELQSQFWKIASQSLNPFQNPNISYKTIGPNADSKFLEQKMNELIDLDESIQSKLTPEELGRLAGGFGATDKSVEELLTTVMEKDAKHKREQHNRTDNGRLQKVVNEGLVYAVRSGDYHTSRQLLILYSVVSAKNHESQERNIDEEEKEDCKESDKRSALARHLIRSPDLGKNQLMDPSMLAVPPPPPLDTDRLRSATNSDGLLAVLGAAQVLRVMKDGSAKRRTDEVISALEEWVEHGQHSVAFRIASWQNQRAAQGDLKIAMEKNSNFMAFAGKKAISNRKTFAQRLRKAAEMTNFTDARFLLGIHEIIQTMRSPCLRLELLQYVLGLDNRYSVAHVERSVELAATCLSMAASASSSS